MTSKDRTSAVLAAACLFCAVILSAIIIAALWRWLHRSPSAVPVP